MDRLPRWRELVWGGWCYIEFQVATAFCSKIRRQRSHDHQQIIDLWTIVVSYVTKCLWVELFPLSLKNQIVVQLKVSGQASRPRDARPACLFVRTPIHWCRC